MLIELISLSTIGIGSIYCLNKGLLYMNQKQSVSNDDKTEKENSFDSHKVFSKIRHYLCEYIQMNTDYVIAKEAIKKREKKELKKLNKKLKDLKKQEEFYGNDVIDITAYQKFENDNLINNENAKLQEIKNHLNEYLNKKGNK